MWARSQQGLRSIRPSRPPETEQDALVGTKVGTDRGANPADDEHRGDLKVGPELGHRSVMGGEAVEWAARTTAGRSSPPRRRREAHRRLRARIPASWTVRSDTIFGRATVDMKAWVAANFAVAKALLSSRITLERPFAVHQVVSEEDGGLGAFATIRRGHRGEVAVITEPTSGRLLIANAGALTFVLRVPGRAAHGGTRLESVSAY